MIVGLIRQEIEVLLNRIEWEAQLEREKRGRAQLQAVTDRWPDVTNFLKATEL